MINPDEITGGQWMALDEIRPGPFVGHQGEYGVKMPWGKAAFPPGIEVDAATPVKPVSTLALFARIEELERWVLATTSWGDE